jgi:hypothetical protein
MNEPCKNLDTDSYTVNLRLVHYPRMAGHMVHTLGDLQYLLLWAQVDQVDHMDMGDLQDLSLPLLIWAQAQKNLIILMSQSEFPDNHKIKAPIGSKNSRAGRSVAALLICFQVDNSRGLVVLLLPLPKWATVDRIGQGSKSQLVRKRQKHPRTRL